MKVIKLLLLSFPLLTLFGCEQDSVDLVGYSPEVKTAIKDFVNTYKNQKNAYIVTDFDNTTAIFDIAYQCSIYQLETMSFAMNVEELRDALATSLHINETVNNYLDDVTNSYQYLIDEYGYFSPRGVKEDNLFELHQNVYWKEYSAKMKCFYDYVDENEDDETSLKWITYWYSGMSEDEVYNMFYKSCKKYQGVDTEEVTWTSPSTIESKSGVTSTSFIKGVSVTDSVKKMLKLYSENNIDAWVCSASHVDGVRAAVDAYELSDYITGVIGMTQSLKDGKFIPGYDYFTGKPYLNKKDGNWEKMDASIKSLPSRFGKVQAIQNVLLPRYDGNGPLAGFMDSSGDFNFCTEFSSLKMVICYNRADRKISEGGGLVGIAAMYQKEKGYDLKKANENGDTYYLLQGRDENKKRSLRESNYTIKYGETTEKLFANDDNYTLYNYLKDNNLTIKNFFDTFVIKTPKEKSVIGVPYGYLASYAGYHSR